VSGVAVTPLDTDAVLDALEVALDEVPIIKRYTGEGPKSPSQAVPYFVLFFSPGVVGGYPFNPGVQRNGTVTIHGVGRSARQAIASALAAERRILAGDIDVEDMRLTFVPDDTEPPYPSRDDSTSPAVYVQALVFDWQLDLDPEESP
jgi:hypothetical protein